MKKELKKEEERKKSLLLFLLEKCLNSYFGFLEYFLTSERFTKWFDGFPTQDSHQYYQICNLPFN